MLISLSEYATAHGRSQISVQQKARRGGFKTASPVMRRIFLNYFQKTLQNLLTFYNQKVIIYT